MSNRLVQGLSSGDIPAMVQIECLLALARDFTTPIGVGACTDGTSVPPVTMKPTAGWPSWTERKLTMDPVSSIPTNR